MRLSLFLTEKVCKSPPVLILKSTHDRTGLLIIKKKRKSSLKTLWEGTAVIAVFLCVGGYRLSAAHTYRGVYQREFSVAFLMDKTSVRKKFVAKRAVPRKKKGKKLPDYP